jgi:Ser/Thr protein kinase RdoA (MazF antagonist)
VTCETGRCCLLASDLAPWSPDATVEGRLGAGIRDAVYRVRLAGEPAVARRSKRAPASLEWELDLVEFLGANHFVVPTVVRTAAGARHAGGVIVTRWIDGRPPAGDDDWRGVAAELGRLHRLTLEWPARPGFRSARELLTEWRGGDVDLSRMPRAVLRLIRSAWDDLPEGPYPVIHGDPGPSNVKLVDGRVALLDWDEARVDCPWFDLADLPVRVLDEDVEARARAAAHAWEAANGWIVEPAYARWRLGLLESFRLTRASVLRPS